MRHSNSPSSTFSEHLFHDALEHISKEIPSLRVSYGVSAAERTTFGIGGSLGCVVEPLSLEDVAFVCQLLKSEGIPFRMLGNGSNLLVSDGGVTDAIVVSTRRVSSAYQEVVGSSSEILFTPKIEVTGDIPFQAPDGRERVSLFVPCSASIMKLSKETAHFGWAGLEFAAGIPATLGGAVWMNAGAHGESIGDRLEAVLVCSALGEIMWLPAPSASYRTSGLEEGTIVLGAVIRLLKDEPAVIKMRRTSALEYRKKTQPLQLPSAGSTFRNPSGSSDPTAHREIPSAAFMLEHSHMKGFREGGVQYSEMHANWIVRTGDDARASEVQALIDLGKEAVYKEFGVQLRPEIEIW